MSYAVSTASPDFATGFPSMVVAGSPLTVIVSHAGTHIRDGFFESVSFSYRIEPENEGRWGWADALPWMPLPESSLVKLWDSDEASTTRAQARPYTLPTSADWSGVLVVVVRSPAARWPNVASVLLVTPQESREMSTTLTGLLRRGITAIWNVRSPVDGADDVDIADVMRRAGTEAESEAQFAGPLIKVNVRSHQETLAVMGGFERRAPQRVLGDYSALHRDLVSAMGSVRRRMQYPGPVRLAYQTLWRGRADSIRLHVEISAPRAGLVSAVELRDLLSELQQEHPNAWQFRARHEEHRIRVFGAVTRFRSRPDRDGEMQGSLDLPISQ